MVGHLLRLGKSIGTGRIFSCHVIYAAARVWQQRAGSSDYWFQECVRSVSSVGCGGGDGSGCSTRRRSVRSIRIAVDCVSLSRSQKLLLLFQAVRVDVVICFVQFNYALKVGAQVTVSALIVIIMTVMGSQVVEMVLFFLLHYSFCWRFLDERAVIRDNQICILLLGLLLLFVDKRLKTSGGLAVAANRRRSGQGWLSYYDIITVAAVVVVVALTMVMISMIIVMMALMIDTVDLLLLQLLTLLRLLETSGRKRCKVFGNQRKAVAVVFVVNGRGLGGDQTLFLK